MRIIDLSLPIDNRMRGVEIAPRNRLETDGWNATTLTLYSHCGTHMDAPAHFLPEGRTIDQQDLNVTMGPALVINLAPAAPRQVLRVDDLSSAADQIRPGVRLLLRTDWYKRYPAPEYRDEMPCISVELAEWLVERRIALLGVEPPSVADVHNMQDLTDVHRTLLGGGVVIVEGLAHLDQLSGPHVHFIALPLKVVAGDGSPVRALAIERNGASDNQTDALLLA